MFRVGSLPAPKLLFASATLRNLMTRLKPMLKQLHTLAEIVDVTAGQIGGEILTSLWGESIKLIFIVTRTALPIRRALHGGRSRTSSHFRRFVPEVRGASTSVHTEVDQWRYSC